MLATTLYVNLKNNNHKLIHSSGFCRTTLGFSPPARLLSSWDLLLLHQVASPLFPLQVQRHLPTLSALLVAQSSGLSSVVHPQRKVMWPLWIGACPPSHHTPLSLSHHSVHFVNHCPNENWFFLKINLFFDHFTHVLCNTLELYSTLSPSLPHCYCHSNKFPSHGQVFIRLLVLPVHTQYHENPMQLLWAHECCDYATLTWENFMVHYPLSRMFSEPWKGWCEWPKANEF